MLYRFVQIQKTVNFLPVVQMVGNGTESVILRDGRKIVFPVVLPECAVVPLCYYRYLNRYVSILS